MIDDDDDFRMALAANLRDDGHEVIEARRPGDLPSLTTLDPGSALIIADEAEHGLPFCDRFHRQHPAVPVILVTPYRTAGLEHEAVERTFLNILSKPLDYDELHALIGPLSASH